jgi:hypothetical protein
VKNRCGIQLFGALEVNDGLIIPPQIEKGEAGLTMS